jgi:hypothetical protein
MGAVDELAVDDRVGTRIVWQIGRASAVPTTPMPFLGFHGFDDKADRRKPAPESATIDP